MLPVPFHIQMRKTLECTQSGQLWKERTYSEDLKKGSSSHISHLVLALLLRPNSGPSVHYPASVSCFKEDFQLVNLRNMMLTSCGHDLVGIGFWSGTRLSQGVISDNTLDVFINDMALWRHLFKNIITISQEPFGKCAYSLSCKL